VKGADGMTFLYIQFHCDICTYLSVIHISRREN